MPPPNPSRLFGEHFLEAFAQGDSAQLIARRNPNLGSLLISERAPAYIQILYRLLIFRREHELEPLHEDVHLAVREALESWSNAAYGVEIFNLDMAQLLEWKLLDRRLEKERIRGYKDNRRTRFRYRLSEEAIAFLEWLEERLRSDLEDRAADARDLLEEVQGSFNELLRMLKDARSGGPADGQSEVLAEGEARRILFQVHKADQCTRDINSALSDFNAALLGFLGREYTLGELRGLLGSLERYVEKYLLQVVRLRTSFLPSLERAVKPKYREILVSAFEIMERERKDAPRLLKTSAGERMSPLPMLAGMQAFYHEGGALDGLCRRINESACASGAKCLPISRNWSVKAIVSKIYASASPRWPLWSRWSYRAFFSTGCFPGEACEAICMNGMRTSRPLLRRPGVPPGKAGLNRASACNPNRPAGTARPKAWKRPEWPN